MKFEYHARDDKGRGQQGVVQAATEEAALRALDRYGLYVTALRQLKDRPFYAKRITLFETVSVKDVMIFSRQLSILFHSHISLVEALNTIGAQTKQRTFREKILHIAQEVEGGTALSDALAQHSKIFSPFYINIVKRGEALGNLSDVLTYLADHLEREHALQSKIKGAMMYPIFVLVVAFAVVTLLAIAVLPNLTSILLESGQELPVVTKVVIAFSGFYAKWWWLFVLVIVAAGAGVYRLSKTRRGKRAIDRFALKVPLLNSFLKMMYVSRFGENLATLIAGGVAIVEALNITGKIVGNELYRRIILEAKDSVAQGSRISEVFQHYPNEFPPIFTQMIRVGERSGSLDSTLQDVVTFYRAEMERGVDAFLSLIEPVMIVGLGVLVGGLMASLMLPLYESVSQL